MKIIQIIKIVTFLLLFISTVSFNQESIMIRESTTQYQRNMNNIHLGGELLHSSGISQGLAFAIGSLTAISAGVIHDKGEKLTGGAILFTGGMISIGFQINSIALKTG